MKNYLLTFAILAAAASPAVNAQQNLAVSAEVGTTGFGLHLIKPLSESLNARVGFNGMNRSFNESTSDANYEIDLKLKTFDALVDYFPMNGAFRLTGGVVFSGNKVNATATPRANGTYTFNGTVYTVASVGEVKGEMEFNKVAPYLGIGWGNAVAKDKGWGFTSDVGVMYTGSPKTKLISSGCTAGTTICESLAADLTRESARLNDDANDLKFYPVIRVGVTYKF